MKTLLPVTINPPESHHGFPYVPIYFGAERGPDQNWADVKGDRRAEVAAFVAKSGNAYPKLVEAVASFLRAPIIGSSGPGSVSIKVQSFNREAAVALLRELGETACVEKRQQDAIDRRVAEFRETIEFLKEKAPVAMLDALAAELSMQDVDDLVSRIP